MSSLPPTQMVGWLNVKVALWLKTMQWLPIVLRMKARDHSLFPVWPGPCYLFCLVYHSPSSWFLTTKHIWLLPSSGRNHTRFHHRGQFTILPLPQIPAWLSPIHSSDVGSKVTSSWKPFLTILLLKLLSAPQASLSSLIFIGNDILIAMRSWLMFLSHTGVNVIPRHYTPCSQHSACHIPGAQ